MPDGVIAGGWSYVIGAYSVTVIALVGYTWSIMRRLKNAEKETTFDE